MTYREAANRIEDHMRVHYLTESEQCRKITDALSLAVKTLRMLDFIQNGGELVFEAGSPLQYRASWPE